MAFKEWLVKPLGKRLIELETLRMVPMLETLFGYDALILSADEFVVCLSDCKVKRKTVVAHATNFNPAIKARIDKLPIANESIDLLYLAHSLEFAQNPHEVLREASRVLRPDGHLIISMFNPLSLWWFKSFAWKGNFISSVKLKDWLALLGFDIMQVNYYGFMLPFSQKNYPTELSWLERYGQKLGLPLGAAYVVEASKRVIPLSPIIPAWKDRLKEEVVSDVTEPT